MQQIREDHDFDNVQTNEILQHLIENRGSDTRNPKWDTYQYSDNFVFYYGGRGAGKIGNGLCTKENKDKGAPQAQDGGYCEVLRSVLTDGQSCASRHLQSIQNKPIDGIKEYCPNFDQIHDSFQRNMVYLQILASLITAESGWKADAKEKAWLKGDGRSMGGKGLFQIDERDAGQDDGPTSDCQDAKNNVMDPKVNIKCGACIALKNLDKDSTIGKGTGDSGAVGMARYFGPFRDAQSSKSNAIKGAVGAWCAKAASSHSTDMFGGASSGSSNR